ncbi:hypothetical protein LXA43DRAFT_895990 [Ganoderma leucocontextum]|nr:hypothetical protein LXA43DRAFT_895990 [Ganoderma leucocontextum]
MGRFKGLDEGSGRFVIPDHIWLEIARETHDAIQHIPSAFVGAIPDLINARDRWTADIWAFWFIYIAPIVLHGRFRDDKYYHHLCDLTFIISATLKLEITRAELLGLRIKIISWVERYEEYYYQYKEHRLSTCLLVVHGLLHIVDNILNAGPMWATWSFFMERFCGTLQRALHSRSHPLSYLHGPCLRQYTPSQPIRRIIAAYLVTLIGGQRAHIEKALPYMIPAWGKVRVGHGGDSIRAMLASRTRLGASERNSSFVRYEIVVFDRGTGKDARQVQYGELLAILELAFDPTQPVWKHLGGTSLLLAIITPCRTKGEDATKTLTLYRKTLADVVVDLHAVQAVVGRVKSRKHWGIIDRSNDVARTIFTVDEQTLYSDDTDSDSGQDDLPVAPEEE